MTSRTNEIRKRLCLTINDLLSQVSRSSEIAPGSKLYIKAHISNGDNFEVNDGDSNHAANRQLLEGISIDIDELKQDVYRASQDGTTAYFDEQTQQDLCSSQDSTLAHQDVSKASWPGEDSASLVLSSLLSSTTREMEHINATNHGFVEKRWESDEHRNQMSGRSTINKLIEGMWEQIHRPKGPVIGDESDDTIGLLVDDKSGSSVDLSDMSFQSASQWCQHVTVDNRYDRALEVVVQAYWMDCYDARLRAAHEKRPDIREREHKRILLAETCEMFSWSEKELRNRIAIWKGYREIREAAGWCALVFSGPGLYRFCKYRRGFDKDALRRLQSVRVRAEVAADTLQPHWRQMMSVVGETTQAHWQGHPHDWVVSLKAEENPSPLPTTYHQWDPDFVFKHLDESIIDQDKWGDCDPRVTDTGPDFFCQSCSKRQFAQTENNECKCFPYFCSPKPRPSCPVQIFRTENGRNNGLVACCTFEPGQVVGEFVGMITKGYAGVDVMASQAGSNESYQIWQGRYGNYTRFINHSCRPNCQFQTFSWLGIQRIVVVSKGVTAGTELTVDYSDQYWQHLDKICLCGESSCRYRDRS